ncbi:MAG: cupredoxin domain-containing protein [Gaiellaceae bacterium]
MKHAAMAGALLGLLAVAVTGCGGKSTAKSSSSTSSGGGQKTIAGVAANDHGTKTVSTSAVVEMGDYFFAPTVIQGKPGSTVTLELKNKGSVEHNFSIAAQKIDMNVQPGSSAKVTVTIPKSGAVSFYCKFHKSSGMAGALEASGSGGMTGTGGGTSTGTTTTKGYGY